MSVSELTIELLLWGAPSADAAASTSWSYGTVRALPSELKDVNRAIGDVIQASRASHLLLWRAGVPLPTEAQLLSLVAADADVAHCGLSRGLGEAFRDLDLIAHDWSMINAPISQVSASWRVSLDASLIRSKMWVAVGGLDDAYSTMTAAGLDFGYRVQLYGGIVEQRPELLPIEHKKPLPMPNPVDIYVFLNRHFGTGWARYLVLRRGLSIFRYPREARALRLAARRLQTSSAPESRPFWESPEEPSLSELRSRSVSVIIPTLGRYPYLPEALESLRRQTVPPSEVIVVDQNPADARQPSTYQGYDDLNLRVIWQDQRGQSLARNTGIAAASGELIFLFDDDSVAFDDLIERHLRAVWSGRIHASTGVAIPPPPAQYELPPRFRHPRIAQTFDTGNSLISAAILRSMGGLDRNYDFGPGTDTDFGTRLYLAGYRILHNPGAIRVHYKAPAGGLRVFGASKYNTDGGLLRAFPPVTQSYYGLRYLTPRQRRERMFLSFATNKLRPILGRTDGGATLKIKAICTLLLSALVLPLKWQRSLRQAKVLHNRGIRTEAFGTLTDRSNARRTSTEFRDKQS